ncbi:MAG TPA: hypothetical protein VKE40_18030 [Gemmataceae bacterium]|nr:hypothetical protein [Gemmataceae bacterium]
MDEELERLRDVVRALVAQRAAFANWAHAMNKKSKPGAAFTDDVGREMVRTTSVLDARQDDLERALARLAEVAPDLLIPPT